MEYNDQAKQAANQPLGEEVDNANGITRRSALKFATVTELSPHAFVIQESVGVPIWDFTTMINWVYSGLVRRPFTGFI